MTKKRRLNAAALTGMSDTDIGDAIMAANFELARMEARDEFLKFCKFMRPDPEHHNDARFSAYRETPLARLCADALEKVERGLLQRTALSAPPQHGKSEIISRLFPAWYSGRNPRKHVFLASYNQDMANSFGSDVRGIMQSSRFQFVFPDFKLAKKSVDFLETSVGGKLSFVGVGGSGSGKPADLMVIDDSIKGDDDSVTPSSLLKLWNWFNKVANARLRSRSSLVILNTRWSQDDLIGRLTDKDHPDYDALIASLWTKLNIPAVVTSPEVAKALGVRLEVPTDPIVVGEFGRKPMAALDPQEHDLRSLAIKKRMDKRTFEALYQGHPSPEEGDYFKAEWAREYDAKDLPADLRIYAASDHAVSVKQGRDKSVLGAVGIDRDENIYVLPDLVWRQMETDTTVEEMLQLMKVHRPALWWMESELISKSFGPFLRKRMIEERVYTVIDPQVPATDKKTRARSIQGRMAMGKVFFPRFAPWWPDARHQLLTFPHASHDDFVDWLAWIGQGLTKELAPSLSVRKKTYSTGTLGWLKASSKARANRNEAARAVGGF